METEIRHTRYIILTVNKTCSTSFMFCETNVHDYVTKNDIAVSIWHNTYIIREQVQLLHHRTPQKVALDNTVNGLVHDLQQHQLTPLRWTQHSAMASSNSVRSHEGKCLSLDNSCKAARPHATWWMACCLPPRHLAFAGGIRNLSLETTLAMFLADREFFGRL